MREISDRQSGEQSAGDRAQTKRSDLEASDPVARGDYKEQRELGITNEKLLQPGQHRRWPRYVISMTRTIPQIVSSVFPTAYVTVYPSPESGSWRGR